MDRIDFLVDLEDKRSSLQNTKDKIMKMRKAGLERKGEFAEENLIFNRTVTLKDSWKKGI